MCEKKESDTVSNKPARYPHDCTISHYLGWYAEYDLYFCGEDDPTVIARYGIDGDYYSGLSFATSDGTPSLYEAKKRAIKAGLLTEK